MQIRTKAPRSKAQKQPSAQPAPRGESGFGLKARDVVPFYRREGVMLGGLLLATLIGYLRCLSNGFVFDDQHMIVHNRFIGQWSFLVQSFVNDAWWFLDPTHLPQSAYYRPLQDVWLGIHYQLFGFNPMPWHATMVTLHLLVVWMVFKVARRLTGDRDTALLAALLFGLLPVHAEAVVWASAIPLPLCAAFELGTFYLFMQRANHAIRNWALALLVYSGALLTHESSVALPGLIGMYGFLLDEWATASERPLQRIRRSALLVAPFAAEVVAYLCIRWLVLGLLTRPNPLNRVTYVQALLTIPPVLAADLALVVMPWMAGPAHRLLVVTSPTDPLFYGAIAALIAFASGFYWLVRNHPRRRLYLFCAAWMGIAVVPMMNLRGLFQQALVSDRYLYMASVGWCVMLADGVAGFAREKAPRKGLIWCATSALIVVFAAALWHVQHFWHDDVTLYTRLIDRYPDSGVWHYAFGASLERIGDLAGAEREFQRTLKIDPGSAALYDLGAVDARLGHVKAAAAEEAEGIKRLQYPTADAYVNLAQLYELSGAQEMSEATLRYAESLPGGAHIAAFARAQSKFNHKDIAGAAAIFRDLAGQDPNDPRVWTMLGLTEIAQKRNQQALEDLQRAIALSPRDPFSGYWTAVTLHRLGRDADALEQCRRVLAFTPDEPNTRAFMIRIQRAAGASASR